MSMKKIAIPLVTAAVLGAAGDAHAYLQFCNLTNVNIWTAYSRLDPGCIPMDGSTWRNSGWWELTPGQCKIVYSSAIPGSTIYYYAEGGGRVWAGPFMTCVSNAVFSLCDNSCTITGSRNVGFRQIDTGGAQNYTLNFTP
ncbi:DUF1036 domain-containing protein [Myxococcus xanthus]|uniref:DUF1036 domain-containing protein n=1 Tax=Myxococcus xanthus TaxID=34 RepID=UPI00112CBD02|nr:DUF1036 domain-containing protein [Myxococcus xanthus]